MKFMAFLLFVCAVLVFSGCSNVPGPDSDLADAGQSRATGARPYFKMPVRGGEVWSVATYSYHNPERAADLNWGSTAEADNGRPIVASFGGKVITSTYSTTTGYGNYVVIDHGGGWTTYYCHLKARSVSAGQHVSMGQQIGTCGNTSAKYTMSTHLHYEQRLNGSPVTIYFDGAAIGYYAKVNRTSKNHRFYINTSGTALNIRSGPGTGYSIVGTIADGANVWVTKQAYGTTVTGTYGTTSVWDYIGSGWVSDAYVWTGSDGLVAPVW